MIKSKKLLAVATFLLIGTQTMEAKENPGSLRAPVAANKVQAGCPKTTAQTDLSINNVRARILNGGDLWWNPNEQTAIYEVPSGSGKNSIYAGSIWIAGFDAGGNLKEACQTYRQGGANDFWSGPISKKPNNTIDVSTDVCSAYDRFWVLNRSDVEKFANTGDGGSSADAISTWPGNGNVSNGELPLLAPFFDKDNNGVYNSAAGDYPYYLINGSYANDPNTGNPICNDYLFGDRTIWWVFNDVGNVHTETGVLFPIGIEIRAQAFAFNTTDEINNMTFYKYQVINRSSDALLNTYFGVWCDADLGNASDDYVGCDVGLGLGYTYNGKSTDDGAKGYGANPPAVGIDFFQGPYADPNDGIDNNLNNVIDEPGEQISMSKFVYYTNTNGSPTGNPALPDDYYQYLSGTWLDGVQVTYGGDGKGGGTNPTNVPCDYMFPDNTDPKFSTPWTMNIAGIQPNDMRFLESAGTFTLQPGAVNYITTGVVWAQSIGGGPLGSVQLMKIADEKAQALFDACFKVLAGPDAPGIAIRELDKQLILTLTNTNSKKVESYNEIDPTIPKKIPSDTNPSFFVDLTDSERSYKFEGYKIYQLADETVKSSDLNDVTKAKLIQAFDINNGLSLIINYKYDGYIGRYIPEAQTDTAPTNPNADKGLTHSINITNDLFTTRPLVNFKPYYFMAVSYAYNNFRSFDYNNILFTQKRAYVAGANNTKAYSGIAHKSIVDNLGTTLNSSYLQNAGAEITRYEGAGNGGNVLDFNSATENEIVTSADHQSSTPTYAAGKGPVKITVIDPVKIAGGSYSLAFDGVADNSNIRIYETSDVNTIKNIDPIDSTVAGIKVLGDHYVDAKGFTIAASQVNEITNKTPSGVTNETLNPNAINAGFLEATMTFSGDNWLTGVKDVDGNVNKDWIKAGKGASDLKGDPNSVFENVIGGTWAPFALVDYGSASSWGLKPNIPTTLKPLEGKNSIKYSYLNSVDLVITSDQSKWSRCPVFETGPTGATRLLVKNKKSVDKNGDTTSVDASFINATGMGWFPGYAVNLETGERLNVAFGENSLDTLNNGTDMLWNPTSDTDSSFHGGRHYIYIFNHIVDNDPTFTTPTFRLNIPKYDDGKYLRDTATSIINQKNFFRGCIWAGIPIVAAGHQLNASDVRIRFRISKAYTNYVASTITDTVNNGNPLYTFGIPGSLAPTINQIDKAKSALDLISVVPNPYYAYSSYERTSRDQLENRIRFINLPSNCKVSIFTLNGTLVRTLFRNVIADVSEGYAVEPNKEDKNLSSTLDWDLNNTAGIKVSSGVYIIHIDAGALGERVIKWFGVMRPIDLDTF